MISLKSTLTAVLLTLVTSNALAFQILSPTSTGCHERITLGALGRESGGFRGDGLPSTASLMNRFIARAQALGIPNSAGTRGVMKEMTNRYHWEGLSDAEVFVLASFVAGVRSPDTNGSSIIDFNKLRSTHLRDTEQSAHALRRRNDDDPNGDTAGIAAARDRSGRILQQVDDEWTAQPYRTERWTFAFRGEHQVTIFAAAFDLGAIAHTIQDTYAHAIRDNSMRILALENYLEVLIDDFHEERDGVKHSDRLDQCNPEDSFDLMRITEARKQTSNLLNAVDSALQSSGSSLTNAQPTLNTIFQYQAGCNRGNDYCGSPWWPKAQEKFSSPYSVGCGLVKALSDSNFGGPSSPLSLAILALPLLVIAWLRFKSAISRARRLHLAKFAFAALAILGTGEQALAFNDPTGGKPFVPWLWEDQFRPTIVAAGNRGSIGIFTGTIAATMVAHEYDQDVYQNFGHNAKWKSDDTRWGAMLASGVPAIGLAVGQLFFDQENGLMHGRAIALTSATHITTAFIANRKRPNGTNRLSFPSGHAANAFTSATSLAYAYGPWVGAPALGLATYIAMSRMADDAHWLSDTVAAAGLGIFWARASYLRSLTHDTDSLAITPQIVPGGGLVSLSKEF